ncbi:MAG: hypothetical protein U1F36_04330 [Planctomycetota bacterium]
MSRARRCVLRADALRVAAAGTLALWLLHAGMRPWLLETAPVGILQRLSDGALALSASPASHAAGFGLLGALLALRRCARTGDAIATGSAVALLVEIAQVFAVARHARVLDLLLDVVAVTCGVLLVMPWRRALRRVVGRGATALTAVSCAAIPILAVWALGDGFRGTSLDGFDARFPITAGREADGTRSALGAIRDVVVLPVAVDAESIARDDLARRADVLSLDDGPAATARMRASESFTVALRYRPDPVEQWGGVRLVTCSEAAWRRNWTVAQRGRGIELRVRCGCTGWNGADHPLRWDGVFTGEGERALAVTWDHGLARLFVDGAPIGPPRSLLEDARGDRLVSGAPGALLGLLLLAPVGAFARAILSRRVAVVVVLVAMVLACVVEVCGALRLGIGMRATTLGAGAGLALVLALRPLGRVAHRRPRRAPRFPVDPVRGTIPHRLNR